MCDYSPSVQKRRAVGMKPAPHPAACEADPDVQDAACCAHSGGMRGAYLLFLVTVAVTLKRRQENEH